MAGITCHNQLNQPCKEKNVEWVYIGKYLHQKNDPKSTILFTQVHKSMLIRLLCPAHLFHIARYLAAVIW